MSEFQVVTCADRAPVQPYYLFYAFKASLARYGIEPLILGWGEKWRGLGSKPKLLKRAIEDGTITAERILFCDAFDVVFADDPRRIPADYLRHYIVWNAEMSCFPDATLADKHPKTASPWRYFNSGVSIGRTELYLEALNGMNADDIPDDHRRADGTKCEPNDQDNWMRQFLFGSVPMKLDTICQFFQTMCNVTADEIDLSGEKIRNVVTGTEPIAFHLNGGSKEFWKPRFLKKLKL